MNGRAVALPEPGRPLEVELAPPNAGESEAHLDLVLARSWVSCTSWPIADLAAEAYLPAVFNYRRQGGSLEQIPDDEKSWDATFGTLATRGDPLPGKVVRFRQYLVSGSAPDVDLGYSVDIAKSYFR